ncbi:hypothetical protein F2P79_024905 [Pimephales promelas]|nr:hypothetical protein F2P79_024905 [Pimephales promelas]
MSFWSPSIRFTGIPHRLFILFGSAEAPPTAHLRQQEDSPPCIDFGRLLPKYGQRIALNRRGVGELRGSPFPVPAAVKHEAFPPKIHGRPREICRRGHALSWRRARSVNHTNQSVAFIKGVVSWNLPTSPAAASHTNHRKRPLPVAKCDDIEGRMVK